MPLYTPELISNYKAQFAYDLDDWTSAGQSPTDTQAVARLNQAKNVISKMLFQVDYSITFTISATTNAATPYNLRSLSSFSRSVIKVFEVIINGRVLKDAKGYNGLWSVAELQLAHHLWRTDAAGTPFIAAYGGNQNLYLYPAPTAAIVSAGANYVSGQYLATDLTVPTTVTTGVASATQTVASTAGMVAGQNLYFATANVERTISSVTNSTVVVLTATVTTTTAEVCSSVPDMPDEARHALYILAAVMAGEPSMSEKQQMMRVQALNARAMQAIEDIGIENRNAMMDMGSLGGFLSYTR